VPTAEGNALPFGSGYAGLGSTITVRELLEIPTLENAEDG
jgi:hypothetical protein